MKKLLAVILTLMLCATGCVAEETAAPEITDAASFAAACAAQDATVTFGDLPTAVVIDDAAFSALITQGNGVAFICDPADPICRALAPVLFAQMAANNIVLQIYLPDGAADCEGLMQRIIDGKIAITGSKARAEELAANGAIPSGAVLYMKEGKIVALHMGVLPDRADPVAALTEDEAAVVTDMLQFQLDKLLSGACDVGC